MRSATAARRARGYVAAGGGGVTISGAPAQPVVGGSTVFAPTIAGGTAPYSLAVVAGSLPTGRSLSGQTVTGTYTTAGAFSYTLRFTDSTPGTPKTADLVVTGQVYPALAPTAVSFAAGMQVGAKIATFTGLGAGETVASMSPNDGRVVIAGGGTRAVVGLTASSAGTVSYTFTTSAGRSLAVAVTSTVSAPYLGFVASGSRISTHFKPAAKQWNSLSPHIAEGDITQIGVVFGAWGWTQSDHQEHASAAVVTYEFAVEYPAGTFTRLTMGGSTSLVTLAGVTAETDLAALSIPKGSQFWIREFGATTDGMYYVDGYPATPQNTGMGQALEYAGSGLTSKVMGGTISNTDGTSSKFPLGVIGTCTQTSVMTVADSRGLGVGDTYSSGSPDVGEQCRAIGTGFGYLNAGAPGDQLGLYLTNSASRRMMSRYATSIPHGLGINDAISGRSSTQMLADSASVRALFPQPFIASTLTPDSTSTDGFATVVNQTATAAEAQVIAYNTAIRAGTAWQSGFWEIADQCESARNSGKWKAPGYTPDGRHAIQLGNIAANDGVDLSQLATVTFAATMPLAFTGNAFGAGFASGDVVSTGGEAVTTSTGNMPNGYVATLEFELSSTAARQVMIAHDFGFVGTTSDGLLAVQYAAQSGASVDVGGTNLNSGGGTMPNVCDGTRKWVQVIWSTSGCEVRVNGTVVGSSTEKKVYGRYSGTFMIRRHPFAGYAYTGKLGKIAIWDIVKTGVPAAGVLYAGNETGLVAYWPLNGSGTALSSHQKRLAA